jgi:hypothetical protein
MNQEIRRKNFNRGSPDTGRHGDQDGQAADVADDEIRKHGDIRLRLLRRDRQRCGCNKTARQRCGYN